MAKLNDDERNKYYERIKPYHAAADVILRSEQDALKIIKQGGLACALKQVEMSEAMLNLASNYIVINGISQAVLKQKNEDTLNDARKTLYKSIIYLEGLIGTSVDAPFADYEQQLALIESYTPAQRYRLVRKMGLAIQLLENAYGDNTKWKWTFVEMEGRYAAVTKNIINLRDVFVNSDIRSPHYEPTVLHLRLIRKLLMQAADRYREKYELSTDRIDDFKAGISYLSALKRLNILTGDQIEATTAKKKLDIWTAKLNSDIAKQENQDKKKG